MRGEEAARGGRGWSLEGRRLGLLDFFQEASQPCCAGMGAVQVWGGESRRAHQGSAERCWQLQPRRCEDGGRAWVLEKLGGSRSQAQWSPGHSSGVEGVKA